MSDTYDTRCVILAEWLAIREDVLRIKNVYEGMSSKHTAYKNFQEMIEEKRHMLDVMQRENPWINDVWKAINKGLD